MKPYALQKFKQIKTYLFQDIATMDAKVEKLYLKHVDLLREQTY